MVETPQEKNEITFRSDLFFAKYPATPNKAPRDTIIVTAKTNFAIATPNGSGFVWFCISLVYLIDYKN